MSEGRKVIESLFDENGRIRSNADVLVEAYGLGCFREGLEKGGGSNVAALTARIAELEAALTAAREGVDAYAGYCVGNYRQDEGDRMIKLVARMDALLESRP